MMKLNCIKELRWEMGLTVHELERLSGVSHSEISKLENSNINVVYPSQLTMLKLAKAFGLQTWEVFELDWNKLNLE